MRNVTVGCALVLLVLLPAASLAQALGHGIRSELKFSASSHDNFFQAPEGSPQEDVTAGLARLQLAWEPTARRPMELYSDFSYTSFSGFDDSTGLRLGAHQGQGKHYYDVFAEAVQGRPTVDFDTDVDTADLLRLNGLYSYHLNEDWEIKGMADFYTQSFDTLTANDNDQFGLGAAVRYRGFGYRFSPEIGFASGARDARSANEDMDQTDVWIKVRSAVNRRLYLTLRYRLRERDYTIGDPGESNFGRRDDRDQWTVTADLASWDFLTWNVYYSFEDADSTRRERRFSTSLLALGVTTHF